MVSVPGITTHAAGISEKAEDTDLVTLACMSRNISLEGRPEENEPYGLFTTKYRVSATKATMRSGPGTNYPSSGTLYKNDVVWVYSISNGWAKFKVNSEWCFITFVCNILFGIWKSESLCCSI